MSEPIAADETTDNLGEEMRCGLCRNYLSVAPIMHLNRPDTYACGRCVALQKGKTRGRAKAYERLAAKVEFPCRYDALGCDKSFLFNACLPHEGACEYQGISCPAVRCPDQICANKIGQHFETKHPQLVLSETKFKLTDLIDQNIDDMVTRFVKIQERDFILQTKSNKTGPCVLAALRHLGEKTGEKVEFLVEITKEDDLDCRVTLKSGANFYTDKIADNADALFIDISAIRKILKPGNADLFIKFEPKSRRLAPVVEEALPGFQDENTVKLERIVSELECQICNELLSAPISTCRSGHSVCFRCKARLSECPLCKSAYVGTRNYQLEKVAEVINPPADNPPNKKVSRITCPVKILTAANCLTIKCNWHGPKDKFRHHIDRNHPEFRWIPVEKDDTSALTSLNFNVNGHNLFLFEHADQYFVMLVLLNRCDPKLVLDTNVWQIGLSVRTPVKYEFNLVFSEGERISSFLNGGCASLCSNGMPLLSGYANPNAVNLSFKLTFYPVTDTSKYNPLEKKVEKARPSHWVNLNDFIVHDEDDILDHLFAF